MYRNMASLKQGIKMIHFAAKNKGLFKFSSVTVTELVLRQRYLRCKPLLWNINLCQVHMSALKMAKKGKKHKAKVNVTSSADPNILDLNAVNGEMQKVLENLQQEFVKTLTLRTSHGALDHIQVTTKDGKFPLNNLAQISSKTPTTLSINMSSFPQALDSAVKALQNSGMNLNPQVQGAVITVPIPKVTKEHRETLAKTAKSICDKAKVNLRNVRGNFLTKIKKSKSDTSKDVIFQLEKQLQQVLDNHNGKADEMLTAKSKELIGK
ncbi:putative ribosome-recycling factor, mitochondrial isoform X2 [Apostichopus japonicus]|uniref:Ribosome-recycling factor, mitochondrial n=1 Tax=Stichopus japonicus TaxID=307972 RepID=A0A2G8KBN6_STIJA|nr:putative ribosome-recycling factor, mitochondrial isoform X2 [Apostichopus japonicus]